MPSSNSFGRLFYKKFDINDRMYWQIDQNGSKAAFAYDALGRLTIKTNALAYTDCCTSDYPFDVYSWENFYYTAGVSSLTGHEERKGSGVRLRKGSGVRLIH